MWDWLKQVIKALRMVLKYASLIVVILSILGFSADALEKWQSENQGLGEKKDDKK